MRQARTVDEALMQIHLMCIFSVVGNQVRHSSLKRIIRCRELPSVLTTAPVIRSLGRMVLVVNRYAFD